MEITLSTRQLEELAYKTALIVTKQLRQKEVLPELVTTAEAARILGITPDRLRKTADRYPHIKRGEGKQGRLMFKRESLLR